MDMWNWLIDLYTQKFIDIEYLEKALLDDKTAYAIYDDFVNDICMHEKILLVREEIKPVLEYLKGEN